MKAVTKREGFSPNLPQLQPILPPKSLSPLQPHCYLPDSGCHLVARGSMVLNLGCTLGSPGNSTPKDSDVIGPGWGQGRARCFSCFSRLRATQPSDSRSLSWAPSLWSCPHSLQSVLHVLIEGNQSDNAKVLPVNLQMASHCSQGKVQILLHGLQVAS